MHKTEHYTDSIYYQIEQTAKYCKTLGMQIFQKLNMPISLDEFAALDVVNVNPAICQRELARIILKDRSNTGRILNSLEEKGYITRFADTKNNRLVRRINITESGKVVVEHTTKVLKEHIGNMPEILSYENKMTLFSLIKDFKNRLEQEIEMNI